VISPAHELEAAQRQAAQRGARLQILTDWLNAHAPDAAHRFFALYPEAEDWFDEDGTPK